MAIHWYPSHMAKAEKALRAIIPQVDVLIEVVDARLPRSSSNPVLAKVSKGKPRIIALNKADLADPAITKAWIAALEGGADSTPRKVVAIEATNSKMAKSLFALARQLAPLRNSPVKPLRLMVAGIPNVGKSTLINALAGRKIANVGDEPGVTKGQQRIRLEPSLYLLDTPGLLWPKIHDEDSGYRLAASGAIRDTSMEESDVARFAILFLVEKYGKRVKERYGLSDLNGDWKELLLAIGRRRGCLVAGGGVEINKVAQLLLKELRGGELGRISFESPGD